MKLIQVEILENRTETGTVGQVREVQEKTANRWIESGLAKPVTGGKDGRKRKPTRKDDGAKSG